MRASAVGLAALALLVFSCGDTTPVSTAAPSPPAVTEARDIAFDLQGHRGARGLRPENSLPSFEAALDLEVDTLELDLHFTADEVVVVWHDPVVAADKCDVTSEVQISSTIAANLRGLRCDRNPDPSRFPQQAAPVDGVAAGDFGIVALDELFDFVESYAAADDKTAAQRAAAAVVRFNVETKRNPSDPSAINDGFDGLEAGPFERAIVELIVDRGLSDRVTIQSFDHRSLWAVHAVAPGIELAALTRRGDIPDFGDLATRGAAVWSPDYRSVTPDTLTAAKAAGLRVVPWTVNDPTDMDELVAMGVDGLITDRPDLVATRP